MFWCPLPAFNEREETKNSNGAYNELRAGTNIDSQILLYDCF